MRYGNGANIVSFFTAEGAEVCAERRRVFTIKALRALIFTKFFYSKGAKTQKLQF